MTVPVQPDAVGVSSQAEEHPLGASPTSSHVPFLVRGAPCQFQKPIPIVLMAGAGLKALAEPNGPPIDSLRSDANQPGERI